MQRVGLDFFQKLLAFLETDIIYYNRLVWDLQKRYKRRNINDRCVFIETNKTCRVHILKKLPTFVIGYCHKSEHRKRIQGSGHKQSQDKKSNC